MCSACFFWWGSRAMSCLLAWLYVAIARRWPPRRHACSPTDAAAMPISSLIGGQQQHQQQQQQQPLLSPEPWANQLIAATVFDAQYCGALRQAMDDRNPAQRLVGAWLDVAQQLQSVSECAHARAESTLLQRHDGQALCFRLRDEQLLEHAHSVLSLFVPTAALPPPTTTTTTDNLASQYR